MVPAAGPQGECDLGDCVSLAVEVSSYSEVPQLSDTHSHSQPPLNNTCASQVSNSTIMSQVRLHFLGLDS